MGIRNISDLYEARFLILKKVQFYRIYIEHFGSTIRTLFDPSPLHVETFFGLEHFFEVLRTAQFVLERKK